MGQALGIAGLMGLGCGGEAGPSQVTTFGDSTGAGSVGETDGSTSGSDSDEDTGSTTGDDDGSSTSADDTTGGHSDLDDGTWVLEQVSDTPPQSLHGAQARLDGGTTFVVWAESKADAILDLDLVVANDTSGGWASEALTDVAGVQHTWPSMRTDGQHAYLVWNGRSDTADDNDLLYAHTDGGPWTDALDLTSAFEDGDLRRDFYPVLLEPDSDELVAVYFSIPIDETLTSLGPIDLRVVRFDTQGNATAPQTALQGGMVGGCGDFSAVADATGSIHAIVVCGPPSATTLVHVTDAGGSWSSQALSLGLGLSDFGPSLATAPDGTVHLVWTTDEACGANACAEVYHARLTANGIDAPVSVSDDPARDDLAPALAIDATGRVLVAWHGDEDVHFAWSADGSVFSSPRNMTPDSPDTTDRFPQSFAFDRDTGLPSLMFERVIAGTQPLNVEIFRARLEP